MIEPLELDRRDDVRSVLEEYLASLDENRKPPPTFIDQVIENWNSREIEIIAKLDAENQILGIVVLGLVSNSISIIFMTEAAQALDKYLVQDIQKELLEAGLNRLKTTGDWIQTSGTLEGSLREHAKGLGFRGFERTSMEISRDVLERINDSPLSDDFSLLPFEEEMKETLGNLILRGHAGSIDLDVFPMFFSTEELAIKLIEDTIENRYGEFRRPDDSRVLLQADTLIGVCLITIRGNYGYIPDICIDPDLRRMGLGRTLLIHTLKRLMASYTDLDGVRLDVTLENPAKHLYDSIGFKELRRYEVLNWLKKWYS
ncbi:MAG: GNAT family N-acetyltransferase [Promethearchaeota archaeon]